MGANVRLWGIVVAIGLLAACQQKSELNLPAARGDRPPLPADAVVATVAGEPITTEQVQRAMIRAGAQVSGRVDAVDEKQALLDELIRTQLLAAAGRQAGYDKDAEVVEVVNRMVADRYLRDLVAANPGKKDVSDDEVRVYYEAHKAEYTVPERARASIILLKFPVNAAADDRAVTRQRAETVLAEAKAKADLPGSFVALAGQYSEDPMTKPRGGDLGWLPKGAQSPRVDAKLVDAIFALSQPGEIGPLVETAQGVVVVKLTERTRNEPRPLEQVAPDIRQILLAEKQKTLNEQRYSQLRERFPVEVKRDVLAAITLPQRTAQADRPPAFPVGVPNP